MNDISIFLFLLSVITLFIVLYLFIRFVIFEKRSFTFEIISIPLGIFKFDKRDEYIKNKKKENIEFIDETETENNENNTMKTDISETDFNECADIIEETALGENQDKLLSKNDFISDEDKTIFDDSANIIESDIIQEEIKQKNSSIIVESDEAKDGNVSDLAEEERNSSDHNEENLIKYEEEYNDEDDDDIVYWTASGKAYHTSKKCRTLSRSKVIFNGTIEDSGRYVKCIHCNK